MRLLSVRNVRPTLDARQQKLVEDNLPELPRRLRHRWYKGYARMIGHEDAYGEGCLAYCRAAAEFNFEDFREEDFGKYACFWLRHFLTRAAINSAVVRSKNNRVRGVAGPASEVVFFHGDDSSESSTMSDWLGEHAVDGKMLARGAGPALSAERRDEIQRILRALPDNRQRYVLTMRSIGLHQREIAERIGVSAAMVGVIERAAIASVRESLGVEVDK